MAKKRQRKSRQSKGIHGSPTKARTSTGMRRLINQLEAHRKGKNVRVTIPTVMPYIVNPDPNAPNKVLVNPEKSSQRFVKVPGKAAFNDPRPKEKRA